MVNQEKKDFMIKKMVQVVHSKDWAWLPKNKPLHEVFLIEIKEYDYSFKTFENQFSKQLREILGNKKS